MNLESHATREKAEVLERLRPEIDRLVSFRDVPARERRDVADEIVVRLLLAPGVTPAMLREPSFLCACVKNWIGNIARRNKAAKRGGRLMSQSIERSEYTEPHTLTGPVDFESEQRQEILMEAMGRLKVKYPQYHSVLDGLLRGRSHAEISAALGINEYKVNNCIHRAKAVVRDLCLEIERERFLAS